MTETEIDMFDIASQDALEMSAQERKDQRLEMCGKAVSIQEIHSGGRRLTIWRCKDPRCKSCNDIRGQEFAQRLVNLINSGITVCILTLPIGLATKFCRKLGRHNYLRIPQTDKEDAIFFIPDSEIDTTGILVDDNFLRSTDWGEFCKRKTSRIVSGSLGKETDTTENPKTEYGVGVMDIIMEPVDLVDELFIKTRLEVIVWNQPESLEEHQGIRNYFNGILLKNITAMNGKVLGILHRKIYEKDLNIDFFHVENDIFK